jgi:hypothetical protein
MKWEKTLSVNFMLKEGDCYGKVMDLFVAIKGTFDFQGHGLSRGSN